MSKRLQFHNMIVNVKPDTARILRLISVRQYLTVDMSFDLLFFRMSSEDKLETMMYINDSILAHFSGLSKEDAFKAIDLLIVRLFAENSISVEKTAVLYQVFNRSIVVKLRHHLRKYRKKERKLGQIIRRMQDGSIRIMFDITLGTKEVLYKQVKGNHASLGGLIDDKVDPIVKTKFSTKIR